MFVLAVRPVCVCADQRKNEEIYLYRLIVSILKMFLKLRVVTVFISTYSDEKTECQCFELLNVIYL